MKCHAKEYEVIFYFIFCMWIFCLHVCLHTTCHSMCAVPNRGQRRLRIPWDWRYIDGRVGAENWALGLCTSSQVLSKGWAVSPVPVFALIANIIAIILIIGDQAQGFTLYAYVSPVPSVFYVIGIDTRISFSSVWNVCWFFNLVFLCQLVSLLGALC